MPIEDSTPTSRWSMENPLATIVQSHQHRFCVNVWAGIVDDFLLDPYILPERLNATTYLIFLQNVLPELLHPIPLNIRCSMWFQYDGVPPHFGNAVRGHLTAILCARWIGRGGPTAWPACSPYLTCLDFFLWGYMKSMVYETDIDCEENLVARIVSAAAEIRETPGIFRRVCQSMAHQCTIVWMSMDVCSSTCSDGIKTGSFLTMQHWSEHFSFSFFFRMKYVLFLLVCKVFGLTQRIM